VYLVLLLASLLFPLPIFVREALVLPLVLYLLILLGQTVALIPKGGVAGAIAAMPLIALSHILYGLGFWRGLILTRFKAPEQRANQSQVVLEIIR